MYKVFRFSITIALIAIAVASIAQNQVQINGTVRDTSQHIVENVNVSVWKADNSSITETTETDALGEYSLGISTSISEVSQINNNIIVINNGISSHIRFSGWLDQKPQAIIISDITGRIISNIPFTYNRFSKQLEAEWQSKISGIYFAQIVTTSSRETLKFITTNNAIPPAQSYAQRAQEQHIAKQSAMSEAIKYYVELSSDGNEPINFVSKLDSVMAYGGETIYPEHVVIPIIPDYTALVEGQVKLNGEAVGEGFKILLTPQQGSAQELYTDTNGSFSTSFTIPPQSFPYNPATLSLEALATPTENSIQTTNAQEEIAITHSTTPFTIDMAVDSANINLSGTLPSGVQGSVIVDGKTIFTGNWPEQYAFNDIKTIKQNVQAQYQLDKYHHEPINHTANINVWETHEYNPTFTLIPAEYTANINGEEGASVTITLADNKAKLTFPSPSNLGKSYSHFSTFHRAADRRFMETSNKEEETLWNYTSNGTDQLQTIERNEIDSILVNLHAQKQGKIDFDTTFYLRENLPAFEENNISFTMQDQMAEYTMRITANENANINITNQETGQQIWNYTSSGTDQLPTIEQTQLDSMLVNLYAQLAGGLEKDTTFYIKPNSTNEFITPNLEIYNTTIQGTINIGEQNVGPNFNITITPENQEPINTTTNEQGQYNTQINLPAQNYPYEPIPTNINIAATPTEQSIQTTNTQTNATLTNTQPTTLDMAVDSAWVKLTGNVSPQNVLANISVDGFTIYESLVESSYQLLVNTINDSIYVSYLFSKYHYQNVDSIIRIGVWDTLAFNPMLEIIPATYEIMVTIEESAEVSIINTQNDEPIWEFISLGTNNPQAITSNAIDSLVVRLTAVKTDREPVDTTFAIYPDAPNSFSHTMNEIDYDVNINLFSHLDEPLDSVWLTLVTNTPARDTIYSVFTEGNTSNNIHFPYHTNNFSALLIAEREGFFPKIDTLQLSSTIAANHILTFDPPEYNYVSIGGYVWLNNCKKITDAPVSISPLYDTTLVYSTTTHGSLGYYGFNDIPLRYLYKPELFVVRAEISNSIQYPDVSMVDTMLIYPSIMNIVHINIPHYATLTGEVRNYSDSSLVGDAYVVLNGCNKTSTDNTNLDGTFFSNQIPINYNYQYGYTNSVKATVTPTEASISFHKTIVNITLTSYENTCTVYVNAIGNVCGQAIRKDDVPLSDAVITFVRNVDNSFVFIDTTDSNGYYQLNNLPTLPNGEGYTVSVIPTNQSPNFEAMENIAVTVKPGSNTINFSTQELGKAFGLIRREDGQGLSGCRVRFTMVSDTTKKRTVYDDSYSYVIDSLITEPEGVVYRVNIDQCYTSQQALPYETTTTVYEGDNRIDFTDIRRIPQKTDILFSTYNEKDSTALSNVLISYYLCGADGMPRTPDDELSLQTTSENGHATLTLPTGQNGYFEAEMTGANADDYFKYSAANFDTKNQILFANDTLARVLFLMVEKEQTIPGTQGLESMTLTDGYEVRQRQGLETNPWSIRRQAYKLSTALLVNDVYGTVEEKIEQLQRVIHKTDSMLYDGRNTIVLTDEVYPGTTVYLSSTNNYYNSYQEVRFRSDPYTQTGQEALDSLGFYANVGNNYTENNQNWPSHYYLNGFANENGQTIITDGETKMGFVTDDPVRKEIFFRLRGRGHPNGILDNTTRTTENLIDRMEQKTYDAFYNHNTTSYTARHLYTNDE